MLVVSWFLTGGLCKLVLYELGLCGFTANWVHYELVH